MPRKVRRSFKESYAYIGYVFVFTLTLRILWGFIGNEYAKWLDIIPYKKERWQAIWGNVKWYLSRFKNKPPLAIGHNPLASIFLYCLVFGFCFSSQALSSGLRHSAFYSTSMTML